MAMKFNITPFMCWAEPPSPVSKACQREPPHVQPERDSKARQQHHQRHAPDDTEGEQVRSRRSRATRRDRGRRFRAAALRRCLNRIENHISQDAVPTREMRNARKIGDAGIALKRLPGNHERRQRHDADERQQIDFARSADEDRFLWPPTRQSRTKSAQQCRPCCAAAGPARTDPWHLRPEGAAVK